MLENVQNQALRVITGVIRSTLIRAMEELTAIQSLSHRSDARQISTSFCPRKQKLEGLTEIVCAEQALYLSLSATKRDPPSQPLDRSDVPTPYNQELSNINVSTSVVHLDPRAQTMLPRRYSH